MKKILLFLALLYAGSIAAQPTIWGGAKLKLEQGDTAFITNLNAVKNYVITYVTGGGTVSTVSVVTANGMAGTVANPTTTPAITLTTTINSPVLAGNGTAISAATTTGSGSTVVLATSPTLVTPALGTPASGVMTNVTGLPISTGVSGLGTGVATFLGTPSSANLISAVTDETGTGALVFGTSPTIATPVLNGLPTGTGVSAAATASVLASRDANANLTAVNFLAGYATTTTAAGTTTLVVGSARQQFFTGTTTQTVTLPVASTLVLGQQYEIVNNSTGVVTVNSSGSNQVVAMVAASKVVLTCILTSGTTAASWSIEYEGFTTVSGTGANVLATSATLTSPTFVTPALGTPASGIMTNVTGTASGLTAGSATVLATARNIYGNSFDGSAALTQIIASTFGGTGNGFWKATGPASTEKTFTFPNASATVLTDNAAVTVAQGGTGAATLSGTLFGNGTSAVTATALGGDVTLYGSNGSSPLFYTLGITTTAAAISFARSSGVLNLNLPNADASNRGTVSTGTQTFAGDKTFNGLVTGIAGLIGTATSTVAAVNIKGALDGDFRSVTATATVAETDFVVYVGTLSADITLNLPACNSTRDGWTYRFMKKGTDAFAFILDPASTETFYDGATTKTFFGQGNSTTCQCENGLGWNILR